MSPGRGPMGGQDNTAWSSSTWTPRAASPLFKGPVSKGSHSPVRMGPLCGGWDAEREILQLCPDLPFPFHHPPFKTNPLSLLPLNSRLCPRVSDAGGDSNCAIQEAALCSGARLRAVTAKRPQPTPRGRGANREQQRVRRKLGPPSGWATEAAGGERGRGLSARPQPYSLRGPGPRLALVTASSCARVWGRLGVQLESPF